MQSRAQRRFTRSTSKQVVRTPPKLVPAAPSGTLINAVIQYADLIKDLGGNQSLMRLSERRRMDPVIRRPLGREAVRLADVAIVWDDEQDQIVRVLDAWAGDYWEPTSSMEPLGDAEVELTSDALAYVHASHGRVQ